MAELLLGVDVGTASTKGVLVTLAGEVVAEQVVPHGLEVPRPGWAEQDAELGAEAVFDEGAMPFTSQAIGPKLRWLRNHERDVWDAARTLHTASGWLVAKLTGESVRDRHSASHWPPLMDLRAGAWSPRFGDGIAELELAREGAG